MDYHKLQQTLFALDPSDRSEDLRKLAAQAQGNAAADASPTKDYITESVDVPDGSMPLNIDSVSDFAKLAGVTLNEETTKWDAFKHGMKNYNKLDALNVSLDDKDDDKDKDKDTKASPTVNQKPVVQRATPPVKTEFPQGVVAGEMYQIKPGDEIGYVNKKGETKVGKVTVMLDTYDSKQRKQIQLKIGNATFAISRANIRTVNGNRFKLQDVEAGSGTIEALEARVAYLEGVIETLLEGKKVPSLKPRDPSAQYMTDLRKSGAMGAHKDKKKDAKAGKMKHKGKEFESIKEHLLRKLNSK